MTTNEIEEITYEQLNQFIGTTQYYCYSRLFSYLLLTDGTKFLIEKTRCYWLFNTIAALQLHPLIKEHFKLQQIQFWTFTVADNRSATLICEWDKGMTVYEERIERINFYLESISIWVQPTRFPDNPDNCYYIAYLPSEY